MIQHNNFYCSSTACDYHTNQKTVTLAEKQLIADGGSTNPKDATCPKCTRDTLVFLYETN